MSLTDAIAEALANATPDPPPGESTTCDWIIVPLLRATGYAAREIVSRIADVNGQFPDYTILPGSADTWFLEAKDWNTRLEDKHAQQGINYAVQNGKRWVVLTNGRQWRLYDTHVRAIASEMLVTEAALAESAAFEPFLRAIGKQSVTAGELERFAVRSRLARVIDAQLADEGSELVRAVCTSLRRLPGLASLTRSDILACLASRRDAVGAEVEARQKPAEEPLIPPMRPPDAAQSRAGQGTSGQEGESIPSGSQTPQRRYDFFAALVRSIASKRPQFRPPKVPLNQNWMSMASGPFGNYCISFARGNRLRVEVYLDLGNIPNRGALNKELFDSLFADRERIEAAVGTALSWERLDDKRASSVGLYRPAPDLAEANSTAEACEWAATSLAKLMDVLDVRLRREAQQLRSRSRAGLGT